MIYEEIINMLLNSDNSMENIRNVITDLRKFNIYEFRNYVKKTDEYDNSIGFFLLGCGAIILIAILIAAGIGVGSGFEVVLNVVPSLILITTVFFLPFIYLDLIVPLFAKKKCTNILNKRLEKMIERDKEIIAKLDKASLSIDDINVKMIYNSLKTIYEVKYEGWENDLKKLENLYKNYMKIAMKKRLSTNPVLDANELEIIGEIGDISAKLEIIKLEFSLKTNQFVKNVYMKITELESFNYDGVKEHIELLNNLVKEYIAYQRTILVNEKANFGEEEIKRETEFEVRFNEICNLIKVYQEKDYNDKIIGNMLNLAQGIKIDDSVVRLNTSFDEDKSLGLERTL